jgi:hypothetical protein
MIGSKEVAVKLSEKRFSIVEEEVIAQEGSKYRRPIYIF